MNISINMPQPFASYLVTPKAIRYSAKRMGANGGNSEPYPQLRPIEFTTLSLKVKWWICISPLTHFTE